MNEGAAPKQLFPDFAFAEEEELETASRCILGPSHEDESKRLHALHFFTDCNTSECTNAVQQIGNMTEWQRKTPLEWLTYVNKEIEVLAAEKQKYKGWVLTVDPVSANILLANPLENGKMSVLGILGHAVQEVKILSEAADAAMKEKLAHLFMPGESQTYSQEEREEKKNSLKNWLEKNHIPVREQGESQTTLCVAGVLTIDPPYGPEDCNSSNEIILSRVQGLIQSYLALQQ